MVLGGYMNEIVITDEKLLRFNIGNESCNTESSLIYEKDGELHAIVLDRCAKNYYFLNGGSGRCVAERDITKYTFSFYTSGLIINIKFKKKLYLNLSQKKLLKGGKAARFNALRKLIEGCGFTTYDLS